MLGEVIGEIEFSGCPGEIELALVNAVFHPPISHVERFGELLAHFGVENALGGIVVGFEGCSGLGLGMAEFFEGGAHGTSVFAAHVDAASFCFGGGRDDVLDRFAEDVDCSISAVAVVPAEVVMGGGSTSCLGLY